MANRGDPSLISKMVRAFVDQLQEVELEAYQTYIFRFLNQATGVQLDGCGEIVGEERLFRGDEEYRQAIYFKTFLNTGAGEPEVLISALRFVTHSANIHYLEAWPAKILMTYEGEFIPDNLSKSMQKISPAGVDLIVIDELGSEGFVYDSTIGPLPDNEGLGYSSVNQIEGGKYSSIVF